MVYTISIKPFHILVKGDNLVMRHLPHLNREFLKTKLGRIPGKINKLSHLLEIIHFFFT